MATTLAEYSAEWLVDEMADLKVELLDDVKVDYSERS